MPPRAQSAHQQASHLYAQIGRRLAGKPLREYRYRDFGSLVSLGEYSTCLLYTSDAADEL